jgi:hypothetical protein
MEKNNEVEFKRIYPLSTHGNMFLPFGVGDFLMVLSEKAFFPMLGLSKSLSSIVVGQ